MTSLMRRKGNIVTETHASKFPKVKVLYNGKHNRLFSQLKFFPHIITDSETRRKIEYTTKLLTQQELRFKNIFLLTLGNGTFRVSKSRINGRLIAW